MQRLIRTDLGFSRFKTRRSY